MLRRLFLLLLLLAAQPLGAAAVHFGILQSIRDAAEEHQRLLEARRTPAGTATVSPTISPTFTRSPSVTASPSFTVSPTPTPSFSASPSFSPSPTFSHSPTATASFSPSPSFSPSRTFSATRSPTPSASPSATPSATRTRTPTATATRTRTPAPSPTPAPAQVLWADCAVGSFLGGSLSTLTFFNGGIGACAAIGSAAESDPFSGSTCVKTLQASGGGGTACSASGPWQYGLALYNPLGGADASGFYAAGHLEFDAKLGPGGAAAISVIYGSLFSGGTVAGYTLNPATLNGSSYTHVSLPFSAFTADATGNVDLPFYLLLTVASPPAQGDVLLYLDDVRWTQD